MPVVRTLVAGLSMLAVSLLIGLLTYLMSELEKAKAELEKSKRGES